MINNTRMGDYVPDHGAMMAAWWYVITLNGLGIFGALVSHVNAIFTAQAELETSSHLTSSTTAGSTTPVRALMRSSIFVSHRAQVT